MKLYRYESHGLRYKHLNCIIMILHVYNRLKQYIVGLRKIPYMANRNETKIRFCFTYPKMIYIDSKAVIFGTNHMSINVAF